MVYIYALYGPDNRPRYIGKTVNLKNRLDSHIFRAKNGEQGHKGNWIRSLLTQGIRPNITVIEKCDESVWEQRERYWISEGKRIGWDLTNHLAGGNGCCKLMQEQVNKSAAFHRGRKRSAETCAKISASRKGKPLSDEHKDAIQKSSGGWNHTDVAKQKIANAKIGNKSRSGMKNSESARAKVSAALTGRERSEEHSRKIAEALRGRSLTKECKAKLSAALKGKPKSEEWKAKMKASWAMRKSKPKQ